MVIVERLPYSDHLVDLIKRCEEILIPKSLAKRALLAGVTAGLVVYLITKKRYKLPPGPRGWPLLGNIREFNNNTIYKKLVDWKATYGPVVSFSVGPVLMVGLSSPDVLYEAFVKRKADFAGRPRSYSMDLMSDGGKNISLGEYTPTWQLHRKLAVKAMRQYMSGSRMEDAVERSLTKGLKLMEQEKGPFNPHKYLTFIVFNIINSICFNYTCEIDDKYIADVMHILDTDLGNGFIEDFFPPLRLFPTKKLRNMVTMANQFFDYIDKDLKKHQKTFSKDNIRDICDAIFLAQEEARDEEDPALLSQITDSHIVQTIADIFGGGLDSSRYTLEWGLLYLAVNPDIQSKVHKEIDKALGSRRIPKLSDRENLQYTDAALYEILRIVTFGPLAIPHTTTCDTKIGDYDIPKGTMVFPNLYAIHHDPAYWKDPEAFKPERFLDGNGKRVLKPENFVPFSVGKRSCPGESVAKPELLLLLTGIMRQFKVSLPSGGKVNLEGKGGSFLNIPNDFEIIVERRA